MTKANSASTRLHRLELLLPGLALLLLGLVLATRLTLEYRATDTGERDRLASQARVIDDNLGRQLEAVNQALLGVQAQLARAHGAGAATANSERLAVLRRAIPGVHMLTQVAADGTVVAACHASVMGTSVANEPYFEHARARPGSPALQVSAPYRDAKGVWTITLSRSLTGAAGEFAGIVAATLDASYFSLVFGSVLYADDMRAVLLHGNGTLFLSVPANDAVQGLDASQPGSFFSRHQAAGGQPTVVDGTTLTGAKRIAAMRTVQRADLQMDQPLVIGVGRVPAAIFAPWRTGALVSGALYLLLVVVSGLALFGLKRLRQRSDRLVAAHEETLAASEARFRSLTQLSSDWYWEQDSEFRFVQFASSRERGDSGWFDSLLGKTRWEVGGTNLSESQWAQHRATLESHKPFRDFEMQRTDRADGPRWLSVSGVPVFDTNGAFRGYRGTTRDITEQVLAKEAMRLSEERLRLALQTSNDAPWDFDAKTRHAWASQRWLAMFGFAEGNEGFPYTFWQDLRHPQDAARVEAVIGAALQGDAQGYEVEFRSRHADGHYLPVLARGSILRDSAGRAVRVTGVTTDLTASKRAEAEREELVLRRAEQDLRAQELGAAEQARALAQQHAQSLAALLVERDHSITEKDELLGLLAHEIRQPLNNAMAALQGAATAIDGGPETRLAGNARLERAQSVLRDVFGTLDNTLTASTLLAQPGLVATQEVEIGTVLRLAVADLGAPGRSRVHVNLPRGARTAELNLALLRVALRNLLVNALNYSPGGSVVELRAESCDDPLALAIEVADCGAGIAPELVSKLFARGTRGPGAALFPGTGLGLYVVAQVVAKHGGSIEVRPNQPRGTVMRIVLPQGRLA